MRLLVFFSLAWWPLTTVGSAAGLQAIIDALETGGSVTISISNLQVLEAPLVITSKRHLRLVGNGTLQGPDDMPRATQWTLVRVEDGKLTIEEEVTVFGRGTARGCVEVASGSTLELFGASKISGCSSAHAGAAIFATGRSTIKLLGRSVIAQSDSEADGGCVAADDESTIQVGETATIAECRAVGNGGGVALRQGSTMIMRDDTQLRHNTAALGGAVSLRYARLELFDRAQLLENQANVNGGGVDVQQYSELVLHDDATVVQNHCANWGGGVHAWIQSHIRCRTSSSIINNTAREGGGVFIAEYDVTFAESSTSLTLYDRATVAHNEATSGGGVYMRGWSTDLLATDTATILRNSATAGSGGGIYSNGGEIAVVGRVVIGYNSATSGGGIFSTTEGGTINMAKNTKIVGNRAFGAGGGVQATSCVGAFLGTILNNQAYKGGGMFFLSSRVELSGLIAANYAETRAGGVGPSAE